MSDFDLYTLVREVCDSSTLTDPATLAKEVGKRIGRNQQREALDQALPRIVQHHLSRSRGSSISPGGHTGRDTQATSAAGAPTPPSRSRKVSAIREGWRKMLRDRINIGPGASDWKFLSDCTVDDLGYAAHLREEQARGNAARAAQLRTLAELLEQHQVATVGELPPDALGNALGSAA